MTFDMEESATSSFVLCFETNSELADASQGVSRWSQESDAYIYEHSQFPPKHPNSQQVLEPFDLPTLRRSANQGTPNTCIYIMHCTRALHRISIHEYHRQRGRGRKDTDRDID